MNKTIVAAYLLTIQTFNNDILSALNNAAQGFRKVPKGNLAFEPCLAAGLIKESGECDDIESLIDAASFEVNKRINAGTFPAPTPETGKRYEVRFSDPQDTDGQASIYSDRSLTAQLPYLAPLMIGLPAGTKVRISSEHPNGEPFLMVAESFELREPGIRITLGETIYHGATEKCPTPNPNGSCPGHDVRDLAKGKGQRQ